MEDATNMFCTQNIHKLHARFLSLVFPRLLCLPIIALPNCLFSQH